MQRSLLHVQSTWGRGGANKESTINWRHYEVQKFSDRMLKMLMRPIGMPRYVYPINGNRFSESFKIYFFFESPSVRDSLRRRIFQNKYFSGPTSRASRSGNRCRDDLQTFQKNDLSKSLHEKLHTSINY